MFVTHQTYIVIAPSGMLKVLDYELDKDLCL